MAAFDRCWFPFYDFLVYFDIEEFDNLEELEYNTVAGLILMSWTGYP